MIHEETLLLRPSLHCVAAQILERYQEGRQYPNDLPARRTSYRTAGIAYPSSLYKLKLESLAFYLSKVMHSHARGHVDTDSFCHLVRIFAVHKTQSSECLFKLTWIAKGHADSMLEAVGIMRVAMLARECAKLSSTTLREETIERWKDGRFKQMTQLDGIDGWLCLRDIPTFLLQACKYEVIGSHTYDDW